MTFGAALAASLLTAGAAGAVPMEFFFNGAVTFTQGPTAEVGAGDPVNGRFTFDSADIPLDSDPSLSVALFVIRA